MLAVRQLKAAVVIARGGFCTQGRRVSFIGLLFVEMANGRAGQASADTAKPPRDTGDELMSACSR
jgi:hypothetical protein